MMLLGMAEWSESHSQTTSPPVGMDKTLFEISHRWCAPVLARV